jgi:hypothetical protein
LEGAALFSNSITNGNKFETIDRVIHKQGGVAITGEANFNGNYIGM